ncbi:MAG: hypothetical protein RLP09_30290 [Sandaracinaceae bacterium]
MRVACLALPFAVLLWSSGCTDDGRLLTVDLRTDLRGGQEFDRVVTEVFPASGRTPIRSVEAMAPESGGRVAELEGLAPGTYRVRVRLLQTGVDVVSGAVILTLRDTAQAVTLVVTSDCRDVPCEELTETCRGGACVDARCSPESPSFCEAPECAAPADCPGPGLDCGDAVCLEGVCGVSLESTRCGGGVCDRVEGCVGAPRDAGADAGIPDAGVCDETPCRLVAPQCGCGATEMCARPADPRCVPPGDAAEDEPCGNDGDCAPGLGCPSNASICRPYCDADGICEGAFCIEAVSESPVGFCSNVCDARDGSGCPTGRGCYLGLATSIETRTDFIDTVCLVPGTADQGEPCPTFSECRPGFACADDACRAVCDLDAPSCTTGTCTELVPPAVIRGVRYGVCL